MLRLPNKKYNYCFVIHVALVEMTLLFYILTNLDDNEGCIGVQSSSIAALKHANLYLTIVRSIKIW